MSSLMYSELVTCSNCGEDVPNYEDCILCGHSLQDPNAAPREVTSDDIQQMMIEAKINELRAKREMLYGDQWDHAPWLERLEKLAEIAPNHGKVYYHIGKAYLELGSCRQAIVYLTAALMLDPTLVDAIRLRGDCQNALVPVLGGDAQAYYDRALADYAAVIEIEPDAYTLNTHAAIISSLGEWDRAIEEYTQAIELDPDYTESFFNRGYTYKVIGEADKAVADFNRFLAFQQHWNQEMVSMAQAHIKELTEPE